MKSSKFPPPPPLPIATSSPHLVTSGSLKSSFRSSTSESADRVQELHSGQPVDENFDPFSLISKSSASDFRRNNDSISSTTTNETDDDCDDIEVDNCDEVEHENVEDVEDVEQEVVLDEQPDEYALDILKVNLILKVQIFIRSFDSSSFD